MTIILLSLPLSQESQILYYIFFKIILDKSHLYATGFRVYLDPNFTRAKAIVSFGVPVVMFALAFLLAYTKHEYFWLAFAYLNIFHVIRQQVGLVNISNQKFANVSRWQQKIDSMAFHGVGFFSTLFLLSRKGEVGWINLWSGASFSLPEFFANFAVFGFLSLTILYTLHQGYLFCRKRQEFNPAKFNFWIITIFLFGGFLALPSYLFAVALLIHFCHSVPYTVLVYKEGARRWKMDTTWRHWLFRSKIGLATFLFVIAFFTWIENGLWKFLVVKNAVFKELHFPISLELNPTQVAFAMALLGLPSLTHFVIDGFIWKSSSVEALKAS